MKSTNNMVQEIQKIADNTRYNSNKVRFVSDLYWNLVNAGFHPVVVNDKYIEIDGVDYHFIKNKRQLTYTVCLV